MAVCINEISGMKEGGGQIVVMMGARSYLAIKGGVIYIIEVPSENMVMSSKGVGL